MNKLLKRTLMVGALAGCLATAAWAGNVEMDMVGDGSILYPGAADGYYETNYTSVNENGDKTPADTKLYFNGNGDVTWGTTTYANGTTTYRYEYDAKGNLVKSVQVAPTTQSKIVTTETYTYNEDGDLTQSRYYSDWNGQIDDYTYTYKYEANKLTVNVDIASEGEIVATRTIVYTLNDNGDPVKRVRVYKEGNLPEDTSVEVYTYDEKGNLISVAAGEDDKREITTYEYNDKDLCVASTWNPSEYSAEHYHSVPNTVKYEYDENGNLTKKTYDSIYETYTYAAIPKEASKSEFKDVAPETYYSAPVIWAAENEITNGIDTEGNFGPDSNCTRGQLVTFLWRAAGSPEPKTTESPFTDVQDTSIYYYKAVLWAVENGVTKGVNTDGTLFAPDATCTRAQIVTMIYRAAGEPKVTAENPFTDVEKNDYYDAILWAVKNGVTTGISKTEFAPNTTCTRGQGVTFLYRGIGLY